MKNPYEYIRFDHNGVAWLTDRQVTVAQVMAELGKNPESKVLKLLKLHPHHVAAAEAFARDSWCTPQHVADVLPPPERLFDPCSNPRSFARAGLRWSLETGQNSLELSWEPAKGLLAYVNAGFSDLAPWAVALRRERSWLAGAAFMCNVDNSTQWWKSFTEQCSSVFLFDRRLPFIPHPGVGKSTNNKAQALIGDRAFFDECKPGLFELGEMYEKTRARSARAA